MMRACKLSPKRRSRRTLCIVLWFLAVVTIAAVVAPVTWYFLPEHEDVTDPITTESTVSMTTNHVVTVVVSEATDSVSYTME